MKMTGLDTRLFVIGVSKPLPPERHKRQKPPTRNPNLLPEVRSVLAFAEHRVREWEPQGQVGRARALWTRRDDEQAHGGR
ncbi:hypothetical protein KGM_211840 [Danaus plexippus plexippus]|uniref:Uncharacterized protein n=1 Tax=Danaus plexippus plexippus TaxID=278856 RepID=A0A212F1L3_DANPL|nr:hypothetical protein KGM_211840 [Danaus plexippus plexippus]